MVVDLIGTVRSAGFHYAVLQRPARNMVQQVVRLDRSLWLFTRFLNDRVLQDIRNIVLVQSAKVVVVVIVHLVRCGAAWPDVVRFVDRGSVQVLSTVLFELLKHTLDRGSTGNRSCGTSFLRSDPRLIFVHKRTDQLLEAVVGQFGCLR